VARTAENPKNRRGFPFYSSGASNPKGSGAQYCGLPNTVIGIFIIIILRQIKPFLLSGFIVKLYSKKGFLPLSDMSLQDSLRPAR